MSKKEKVKRSNTGTHKGVYTVQNRKKYIAQKPPIFRSGWEASYMRHCDLNPKIVKWGSECVKIPYYDPTLQKNRNYIMDFIVIYETGRVELIEVKPHKQTIKPRITKKKSKKTIIHESQTYDTNLAKWEAAREFCRKRDYDFRIITEKVFKF
jgi:hypothetical protein